jgi:O-methyltransferase
MVVISLRTAASCCWRWPSDAPRAQKDFAVVQRDEFMGQRDALLAQRDALTAQTGLLASQRDDLIVQVASLAGAAAARDRLSTQLAALAGGEGAGGLATLAARLEELRARYLDLMESVLIGTASEDPPLPAFGQQQFDPNIRQRGLDWPSHALSMIGAARMRNFRVLLEQVICGGIAGDIVETGVWRGGASILARAVLAAYGVKDRKVILCDSFEGLPPPDPRQYPADEGATFHEYAELAVSEEEVRRNFEKFGLFDDQVVPLKGWFKATMAHVPSNRIAILRLDGDLYESTIIPLKHLFDKVPAGGFIIVDDYECVPACKLAVDDFLVERALKPDIRHIDGVGVFFQKS